METWVIKDDVKYPCKSEEQLKLFLGAGYKEIKKEKPKAEKNKDEK